MSQTESDQLVRRNYELNVLNQIADALNQEVNLGEALRTTLALVAELMGLKTGWIWLMDEETDEAYLAAEQHLPASLKDTPGIMDGRLYCYCLDEYRSGDLDGPENVQSIGCSRLRDLGKKQPELDYHAVIALNANDKQLGLLNVASADRPELSEDDLRLLHTVGDLLSMAIERTRLYGKSAQMGAMEERNRLAREIHDTIAQGLAGLALKLETVDALMESNAQAEKTREYVQQALALTRQNLDEVRRSVMDLRAAPLEERSLTEAIQALIESVRQTSVMAIEFTESESRRLPVRLETSIYRVVEQALTNIRQHAEARNVTINLVMSPENVTLSIEDDGCGFDTSEAQDGHYGLVGMNERIKLAGGAMTISSSPGEGTRIEATIPIEG